MTTSAASGGTVAEIANGDSTQPTDLCDPSEVHSAEDQQAPDQPAPPDPGSAPFAVDDLTERQLLRRNRILGAAYRLAATGGYDQVQIRDVAAEAGVALGTLYNYFASKDHLLASLLVEWSSDLEHSTSATNPPNDGSTADRLVDLLSSAMEAMWIEPQVTRAAITALNGAAPEVSACQSELKVRVSRMMAAAFPAGADPVWQANVIRTIEHVWFSTLLSWVNEWMTPAEIHRDVEAAVRLLVATSARFASE